MKFIRIKAGLIPADKLSLIRNRDEDSFEVRYDHIKVGQIKPEHLDEAIKQIANPAIIIDLRAFQS
jgi:hypothetical protein